MGLRLPDYSANKVPAYLNIQHSILECLSRTGLTAKQRCKAHKGQSNIATNLILHGTKEGNWVGTAPWDFD